MLYIIIIIIIIILSCIYGKIQKHILNEIYFVNKCTGIAIRDLCNARYSNVYIMPDNESIYIIEILCTNECLLYCFMFYCITSCIICLILLFQFEYE